MVVEGTGDVSIVRSSAPGHITFPYLSRFSWTRAAIPTRWTSIAQSLHPSPGPGSYLW